MAIYGIADLHLSLGTDKPMDIFQGWKDYVQRLEANWRAVVQAEDTVVIAGDISWAMSLDTAVEDFSFIHTLPGKKIILKGNHDYWWSTMRKMETFFAENGLDSIRVLHNNSYEAEGVHICGTRGWIFEKGKEHDKKIAAREAARLAASLNSVKDKSGEKIVFLHYPPIYGEETAPEILDIMLKAGVKRCYYGHIHGSAASFALRGQAMGIEFELIASDFLKFMPLKIKTS